MIDTPAPGNAATSQQSGRSRLRARPRWAALSESTATRAIFALLTVWCFSYLLAVVLLRLSRGGKVNGADGTLPEDQLFYMGWIRDASESLLISNRWDLADTSNVFLHPMYALSGLLARLGLDVELSYLLWKPVAVVVLFAGFAAYVRRMLPPGRPRIAALLVALFFFPPASVFVAFPPFSNEVESQMGSIARELSAAQMLWGYHHAAIALGLMPVFLLGAERLLERRGSSQKALLLGTSAAGLAVSWLHPWQGLTLLLMIGGLAFWGRLSRRYMALLIPALATSAPLVYFWALARFDDSWRRAEEGNAFLRADPWVVALALAPLALLAVLEYRRGPHGDSERLLLLWPPAVVALYVASILAGLYPLHAIEGVTLPLAILTVRGALRLRLAPTLAVFGVVVLTLPVAAFGARHISRVARGDAPRDAVAATHLYTEDEWRALQHLDRAPQSGGVLAPAGIAVGVPAFTGRKTWVGQPTWSPDFDSRWRQAEALFDGQLGTEEARRFVRATGAGFLLSDCRGRVALEPVLGPLVVDVARFGCAAVYRVRPAGE